MARGRQQSARRKRPRRDSHQIRLPGRGRQNRYLELERDEVLFLCTQDGRDAALFAQDAVARGRFEPIVGRAALLTVALHPHWHIQVCGCHRRTLLQRGISALGIQWIDLPREQAHIALRHNRHGLCAVTLARLDQQEELIFCTPRMSISFDDEFVNCRHRGRRRHWTVIFSEVVCRHSCCIDVHRPSWHRVRV